MITKLNQKFIFAITNSASTTSQAFLQGVHVKTKISCKQFSLQYHKNLLKIRKLDNKTDAKVAEFHISVVKQKVGKNGVMDKQHFWKLKSVLALKSLEIPYAIEDAHGNLITDAFNIDEEYRNEFRNGLRKREICDDLLWYESFQYKLCMLQIASKRKVGPDFTMDEVKTALHDLKTCECRDPLWLIPKVSKHASEGFFVVISGCCK